MSKIASGEWKVEQEKPLGYGAQWYLIRARP
jgi:hypothetical protein